MDGAGGGIDTSSPPRPVANGNVGTGMTTSGGKQVQRKVDGDDELDSDEVELRRARKKSMEDGIHVVSAFEGEWVVPIIWAVRNDDIDTSA